MNWLIAVAGLLIVLAAWFAYSAIRRRQRFEVRRCKVVGLLRLADLLSPRCDWEVTTRVLIQLKVLYWKNLVEPQPLRLRLSVFDERCDGRWLFENEEIIIAILSDIMRWLDSENDRWASREVVRWLMQNPRFYYRKLEGILAQMIKRHPEIENRLRLHIQFAERPLVLKPSLPKTKPRARAAK